MSKSEWAIKLEGCNFEMARDEIAQMFAIAQEDAKRQGGEVLIHPELHNVLMLFYRIHVWRLRLIFCNVLRCFSLILKHAALMGHFRFMPAF